jgi:RNA polymerase sigma-70 factor (ECF subfamily)
MKPQAESHISGALMPIKTLGWQEMFLVKADEPGLFPSRVHFVPMLKCRMFVLTPTFTIFSLPENLYPHWLSFSEKQILLLFSMSVSPELGREIDQKMIQEALSGDPGFEKLVKTYEQMVYRVAYRFLNNETDASDVSQEVFIRVHRSLPQFRGDSALSTWIYTITANLSRNAIRSKKNRAKVQMLAPQTGEDDRRSFWDKVTDKKAVSSSRKIESGDMREAIQAALAELPPDFREAVILRDLEDLDYAEIAKVLKAGVGTIKSRIFRGRSLLREQLKDWL